MNAEIARAVRVLDATSAAIALTERGVNVKHLRVGERGTVIDIEPPPAWSWIRGVLRRRVNGVHEYAAPFRGCQLRWEVSRAPARAA